MGNVHFIKLSNGETILADIISFDNNSMKVMNPIEISIRSVSHKDVSAASMVGHQWLPFVEEENIIDVNMAHIVAISVVSEYVENFYVESVQQYLYPETAEKEQSADEERYKQILEEIKKAANNQTKMVH